MRKTKLMKVAIVVAMIGLLAFSVMAKKSIPVEPNILPPIAFPILP